MQDYVVGFLFREEGRQVALIQKKKPAWQFGLLNGIGGKIESTFSDGPLGRRSVVEEPLEAMIREFREEAGVVVADWEQFFVLKVPGVGKIHFFKSFKVVSQLKTMTDEEVRWFTVEMLWPPFRFRNPATLPNLQWLIPMALDANNPWGVAENQA